MTSRLLNKIKAMRDELRMMQPDASVTTQEVEILEQLITAVEMAILLLTPAT